MPIKKRLRTKLKKKWENLQEEYAFVKHPTFVESLQVIQVLTQTKETLKLDEIFHILAGRGYPALLILIGLPFIFPIQIPGLSTPFGLILTFIGLRMAFGKKPWWPDWIKNKEVKSSVIKGIADKTIAIFKKVQKVLKPRLPFLLWDPFKHLHGLTIFFLAIFLSLPLPIPFTNTLASLPIILFGIGMLEDDGLIILMAYFCTLLCLGYFLILLILLLSKLS